MARPFPNTFEQDSPLTPQSTSSNISYQTNVSRQKTRKWAEAKPVDYGGDDWGDDEYEYDPPPPSQISKPTGLREQGHTLPATPKADTLIADGSKKYGNLPALPGPSGGHGRNHSFDADDEKRNFSTTSTSSQLPAARGNTPPTQFSQITGVPATRKPSDPPALQITTQLSQPQQLPRQIAQATATSPPRPNEILQGREELPAASRASDVKTPSTASDIHARPDYSPSAVPQPLAARPSPPPPQGAIEIVSGKFPDRKSSLSQSTRPPMEDIIGPSVDPSTPKPWTTGSAIRDSSPGASSCPPTSPTTKALPFIRPADIYKRRMEEERDKERKSMESSRPNLDSLMDTPSNDNAEPLATHTPRHQTSSENLGSHHRMSEEPSDSSRRLMPMLESVEERKSEYGFEGVNITDNLSREISNFSSSRNTDKTQLNIDSIRRLSTSPKLPDLNRISGFGLDMFTQSDLASNKSDVPPTTASTVRDLDANDAKLALRNQPSLGFTSIVHQAFDTSIPTTSASRSDSGVRRSDSESTGTTGISPIISRASSSANPTPRNPEMSILEVVNEPLENSIEHDVPDFRIGHRRDISAPSPGNSLGKTPDLASSPSILASGQHAELGASPQNASLSPSEPLAALGPIVDYDQSSRPTLPGGWNSNDKITTATSGPTSPSPLGGNTIINSTPSSGKDGDVHLPKANVVLGPALDVGGLQMQQAAPETQHRPDLADKSIMGSTNASPTPPPKDRLKINSVESDTGDLPVSSTPLAQNLSSQQIESEDIIAPPSDDENERLRKEIVKSLTPRLSDAMRRNDSMPSDQVEDRSYAAEARESAYLPAEYGDYWASNEEDIKEAAITTTSSQSMLQDTRYVDSAVGSPPPSVSDTAVVAPLSPRRDQETALHAPQPALNNRFSWEKNSENVLLKGTLPDAPSTPAASISANVSELPAQDIQPCSELDASYSLPGIGTNAPSNQALSVPAPSSSQLANEAIESPHDLTKPHQIAGIAAGAVAVAGIASVGHNRSLQQEQRTSLSEEKDTMISSSSYPVSSIPLNHELSAKSPQPYLPLSTDSVSHPAPSTVSPVDSPVQQPFPLPTTKLLGFKDITAISSPQQRIKTFNDTRQYWASIDPGLNDWMLKLQGEHPELANTTAAWASRPGVPDASARTKFSKAGANTSSLQQPYYQQYLNASSPTTPSTPTSSGPGSGPSFQPATQQGFAPTPGSKLTSHQVQAKGKEFLHTAGIFGGKAGKAGKGLLAKGKNKLRGAGGGDKTSTSPPPSKPKSERRSSWALPLSFTKSTNRHDSSSRNSKDSTPTLAFPRSRAATTSWDTSVSSAPATIISPQPFSQSHRSISGAPAFEQQGSPIAPPALQQAIQPQHTTSVSIPIPVAHLQIQTQVPKHDHDGVSLDLKDTTIDIESPALGIPAPISKTQPSWDPFNATPIAEEGLNNLTHQVGEIKQLSPESDSPSRLSLSVPTDTLSKIEHSYNNETCFFDAQEQPTDVDSGNDWVMVSPNPNEESNETLSKEEAVMVSPIHDSSEALSTIVTSVTPKSEEALLNNSPIVTSHIEKSKETLALSTTPISSVSKATEKPVPDDAIEVSPVLESTKSFSDANESLTPIGTLPTSILGSSLRNEDTLVEGSPTTVSHITDTKGDRDLSIIPAVSAFKNEETVVEDSLTSVSPIINTKEEADLPTIPVVSILENESLVESHPIVVSPIIDAKDDSTLPTIPAVSVLKREETLVEDTPTPVSPMIDAKDDSTLPTIPVVSVLKREETLVEDTPTPVSPILETKDDSTFPTVPVVSTLRNEETLVDNGAVAVSPITESAQLTREPTPLSLKSAFEDAKDLVEDNPIILSPVVEPKNLPLKEHLSKQNSSVPFTGLILENRGTFAGEISAFPVLASHEMLPVSIAESTSKVVRTLKDDPLMGSPIHKPQQLPREPTIEAISEVKNEADLLPKDSVSLVVVSEEKIPKEACAPSLGSNPRNDSLLKDISHVVPPVLETKGAPAAVQDSHLKDEVTVPSALETNDIPGPSTMMSAPKDDAASKIPIKDELITIPDAGQVLDSQITQEIVIPKPMASPTTSIINRPRGSFSYDVPSPSSSAKNLVFSSGSPSSKAVPVLVPTTSRTTSHPVASLVYANPSQPKVDVSQVPADNPNNSKSFLPPIRRTSTFGRGFGSHNSRPKDPDAEQPSPQILPSSAEDSRFVQSQQINPHSDRRGIITAPIQSSNQYNRQPSGQLNQNQLITNQYGVPRGSQSHQPSPHGPMWTPRPPLTQAGISNYNQRPVPVSNESTRAPISPPRAADILQRPEVQESQVEWRQNPPKTTGVVPLAITPSYLKEIDFPPPRNNSWDTEADQEIIGPTRSHASDSQYDEKPPIAKPPSQIKPYEQPPSSAQRYPDLFKPGQSGGDGTRASIDLPVQYYQAPISRAAAFLPRQQTNEYQLPGVGPPEPETVRSASSKRNSSSAFFKEIGGRLSRSSSRHRRSNSLSRDQPLSRGNEYADSLAPSEGTQERQRKRSSFFGALHHSTSGFGTPASRESVIAHHGASKLDLVPGPLAPSGPVVNQGGKKTLFTGSQPNEPKLKPKKLARASTGSTGPLDSPSKKNRFSGLTGIFGKSGQSARAPTQDQPQTTIELSQQDRQPLESPHPVALKPNKALPAVTPALISQPAQPTPPSQPRNVFSKLAHSTTSTPSTRKESKPRRASGAGLLGGLIGRKAPTDRGSDDSRSQDGSHRTTPTVLLSQTYTDLQDETPNPPTPQTESVSKPNMPVSNPDRGRRTSRDQRPYVEPQYDSVPIPGGYSLVRGQGTIPVHTEYDPKGINRFQQLQSPLVRETSKYGAPTQAYLEQQRQHQIQSNRVAQQSYQAVPPHRLAKQPLPQTRAQHFNPSAAAQQRQTHQKPVLNNIETYQNYKARAPQQLSREDLLARSPPKSLEGQQRPYQISLPGGDDGDDDEPPPPLQKDNISPTEKRTRTNQGRSDPILRLQQPTLRHPDSPAGYPLPDDTVFSPINPGASDMPPPPPPKWPSQLDHRHEHLHERNQSLTQSLSTMEIDLDRSNTRRTAVSAVSGFSSHQEPQTSSTSGLNIPGKDGLHDSNAIGRNGSGSGGKRGRGTSLSSLSPTTPSPMQGTPERSMSPEVNSGSVVELRDDIRRTEVNMPIRPSSSEDLYSASPRLPPPNPKDALNDTNVNYEDGNGNPNLIKTNANISQDENHKFGNLQPGILKFQQPEEKIPFQSESEMGMDTTEDDHEPATMSATSYPGQEWNPYIAGGWEDGFD